MKSKVNPYITANVEIEVGDSAAIAIVSAVAVTVVIICVSLIAGVF